MLIDGVWKTIETVRKIYVTVGRGLEQAGPPHPVRAVAVLHPGADLALHQCQQGHAHRELLSCEEPVDQFLR